VAFLHDIDMIDDRRMQRKDPLNADAETRLAHGDGFADAAVLAGNADAFECLQTFFSFDSLMRT
jgi:hypothetical protein